jgi:hypothetical protein
MRTTRRRGDGEPLEPASSQPTRYRPCRRSTRHTHWPIVRARRWALFVGPRRAELWKTDDWAGPPNPGHLIGLAWHHVLHARSCIERGKPWQAEYWISGIRDQTLALACLRFGEPTDYAKGADALPSAVTGELADALVRSLALEELRRALRVAATQLLGEVYATDAGQARRLEQPIRELADLPGVPTE